MNKVQKMSQFYQLLECEKCISTSNILNIMNNTGMQCFEIYCSTDKLPNIMAAYPLHRK